MAAVKISGVLRGGTGKPVPGCIIELKAKRTSETVIATTVAYGMPEETGSYSMDVEPEKWLRYVIEHIQDWPANRVRDLLPWKVDLSSQ